MRMKVRLLLVAMVVMAEMYLAGCGHYTCGTTFGASSCSSGAGGISQGGGGTTKGTYLLIADAGNIQGEVLDPTAKTITLTPGFVPPSTVGGDVGNWMVVAGGKFMYTGYVTAGDIFGWTLNGNGTITAINGVTPLSALYLMTNTGAGTQAMVANPAGTMLFVLDQNGEQVDVYQIGATGALSANPTLVTLPSGFRPFNLAVDGQGKFLYVSNISGGVTTQVAVYSILGTTVTASGSPLSSSLMQMQGEASGKYMIGTSSDFSGVDKNIHVMSIDASTGALTEVGTGTPTVGSPQLVAVQPNAGGTLVYTIDFTGSVEGATLNLTTGALTAVTGSPFALAGLSAKFDPIGKYLFVVEGSGVAHSEMFAYDVSASPALTTSVASVGWADGDWQAFDTQ